MKVYEKKNNNWLHFHALLVKPQLYDCDVIYVSIVTFWQLGYVNILNCKDHNSYCTGKIGEKI